MARTYLCFGKVVSSVPVILINIKLTRYEEDKVETFVENLRPTTTNTHPIHRVVVYGYFVDLR